MAEERTSSTFDRAFLDRYQGFAGAFGDPDGKRADLADFIDVAELRRSALFGANSRRVRVVVGRKGSGKTFYLKRLKVDAEADGSRRVLSEISGSAIVEEAEQTQLFGTRQVVRVAHWFPEKVLTEIWQQLWGRAILMSVASHLLYNRKLQTYVAAEDRKELRSDFGKLLNSLGKDPRSPFTTAKTLIDSSSSSTDFVRNLDNPYWDDLESRLGQLLHDAPPVYLFVDAVDEEFTHAPMYWLRCQKGLFYETMRFLRHTRLGSRLHIVISIRDLVLYSVFRSEHASRYVGDPHLRVLGWNFESARALADAKTRRLESEHWVNGVEPRSLAEWIGLSHVANRLGGTEDVYEYALRHTQCLPRDVVLLGNYLGKALADAEETGRKFNADDFREIVSDLARISGLQQLEIAANQIRADEIPAEASEYDFVESYLSIQEYADTRASQLIEVLRACKMLRISLADYLELQDRGRSMFGAPDLGSVLWQAGLLGFRDFTDGERDVFFSLDKMGRFRIPDDAEQYVFHPSMRESVGLAPIGPPIFWRS